MNIDTSSGTVVGATEHGVVAYSGIRYGRLAGGRRFDPVAPATPDSPQDERTFTAVFPQLPSRLDAVMGSAVDAHPQAEDAFLLNVWAPEGASELPVLVFVHGGAFVSGGGGVRWYRGHVLARDANAVVVTVNYRLGALGHLVVDGDDGDDGANRPVGDLVEALRWVKENIGQFGGDASNITLAGQSAGGFYAKLLAVLPPTRPLIRRLFLLSVPGVPAASCEWTEALSARAIARLDGADPREVEVQRLLVGLRAEMAMERSLGVIRHGLMPTVSATVPSGLDDAGVVAAQLHVEDLLVTFTRDESASFFFAGPERTITREQLAQIRPEAVGLADDPYWALVASTTADRFAEPSRQLAAAAAARGITTRVREFTYASPLDGVGSGHGFDAPFLFGNWDDWTDAPMLRDIERDRLETESAALRRTVADFVHGRLATAVQAGDERRKESFS